MTITVIGLDIAKNVFQVHGVDETGQVVLRRRLRRCDVLRLFGELPPALVGIEACHTGHFWARQIKALGHDVRLMPPQFVKPYVKTQKNDAADAEAICEAVTRPSMRFVPIKTAEQQSVLLLHRARDLLIRQRSSLVSAIKAHCAEFGIILAGGARDLDRFVQQLNDVCRELPDAARDMLALLGMQVRDVAARASEVEKKLLAWHRTNEVSRRLATIPGIGPITASAIAATVVDAAQFKTGRQFAAWLGLVPQQHSSGGKERLGSISKRGDGYIRRLLIHGARAIVGWRKRSASKVDRWISGLLNRRPVNVATVALANKSARIAWALMSGGTDYDHRRCRAA